MPGSSATSRCTPRGLSCCGGGMRPRPTPPTGARSSSARMPSSAPSSSAGAAASRAQPELAGLPSTRRSRPRPARAHRRAGAAERVEPDLAEVPLVGKAGHLRIALTTFEPRWSPSGSSDRSRARVAPKAGDDTTPSVRGAPRCLIANSWRRDSAPLARRRCVVRSPSAGPDWHPPGSDYGPPRDVGLGGPGVDRLSARTPRTPSGYASSAARRSAR